MNFTEQVEVTFRFSDDMPWMKVWMTPLEYASVLGGGVYKGLVFRNILTESFQDAEENEVQMIYDTFDKSWYTEFIDVAIESESAT